MGELGIAYLHIGDWILHYVQHDRLLTDFLLKLPQPKAPL